MRLALAIVSLLALAACTNVRVRRGDRTTVQQVTGASRELVLRASDEWRCPVSELVLEPMHGGAYRVTGCGQRTVFVCRNGFCTTDHERGERRALAGVASQSGYDAQTWTDEEVRGLLVGVHARLVGCLPVDVPRARLSVTIAASGDVARSAPTILPPESNACVDRELAGTRMPRRVSAGRRVVFEVVRGAEVAVQVIEAVDAVEEAPSERALAPDAAARAAVDGRAASILACVEAGALSMQLSWDVDGHLDALLRGAHQGTPEEACVRAIVQALSITPRPGREGVIVHALQR